MHTLKVAYKAKSKKKAPINMESVRALAEIFEANHFKRREKKLKKSTHANNINTSAINSRLHQVESNQ